MLGQVDFLLPLFATHFRRPGHVCRTEGCHRSLTTVRQAATVMHHYMTSPSLRRAVPVSSSGAIREDDKGIPLTRKSQHAAHRTTHSIERGEGVGGSELETNRSRAPAWCPRCWHRPSARALLRAAPVPGLQWGAARPQHSTYSASCPLQPLGGK